MNRKLKFWLSENANRLIELKLLGAAEYFAQVKDPQRIENLSGDEWIEFISLTSQLDVLLWALAPQDKKRKDALFKEIKKYFAALEKERLYLQKLTGQQSIPRGEA